MKSGQPKLRVDDEMMDVRQLCFVCSNAIQISRERENESSLNATSVKVLISYILVENEDGERNLNQLQDNILSSFDKGNLSICHDCLSSAEYLLRLHLELEKIQMQILDALRNLQGYLSERTFMMAVQEDLKDYPGQSQSHDDFLPTFHGISLQRFIKRKLYDKAQVRLERLNIAGLKNRIYPSRHPSDLDSSRNEGDVSSSSRSRLRSRKRAVASVKHELMDTSGDSDVDDDDDDDEDFAPEFNVAPECEDDDDDDSNNQDSDNDEQDEDINHKRKRGKCRKVQESKKNRSSDSELNKDDGEDNNDHDEDDCPDIYKTSGPKEDDKEVSEAHPPLKKKRGRGRPRKGEHYEPPKKSKSKMLLWDCDICLEGIPFKEFKAHLKTHPEFEKIYTCDICPTRIGYNKTPLRIYGTYKGLIWHYLRHSQCIQIPCKLCPEQNQFILFSRAQLCKHLYEIHHPNHKKLPCKNLDCSEEFCDPESRKVHFRREHSQSSSCEICGKTLKRKESMKRHMNRYHLQLERFFCASCPKEFKTKYDLQSHEDNLHGTELLQCPQCPKQFFSKKSLRFHLRQVHGERKFHCQFCDKSFTTFAHLKPHEEAHRGEKKYMCSKCPYLGTTKVAFRNHLRIHDGKKFPCPSCNKAFSTKAYRDVHHRTRHHSKSEKMETPYECEICHAVFAYKTSRNLHRRKVHGVAKINRCLARVGVVETEQGKITKPNA